MFAFNLELLDHNTEARIIWPTLWVFAIVFIIGFLKKNAGTTVTAADFVFMTYSPILSVVLFALILTSELPCALFEP